jgi:hypothetical protein
MAKDYIKSLILIDLLLVLPLRLVSGKESDGGLLE